jgi:LemA protein
MNRFTRASGALLIAVGMVFGLTGCGSYNRLVTLEQNVNKKWADVQSVYQRRADLIPNLVNTVQGAANFEKSTLTEVTNARASVGRVTLDPSKAPTDAAQLQQFQEAQGQLSNALSRLLVVSENYPQLRATEQFQNLQAQLEGTENRVSVERNNFNGAVQEYNTALGRFPTNMLNKMFGFQPRPFFTAQAGAERAPTVNFGNFGNAPAVPPPPAAPAVPPPAAPVVPATTPAATP